MMSENIKRTDANGRPEKDVLFYELISGRFLPNRGKIREVFEQLSIEEYIILHALKEKQKELPADEARIYLQDIADKMEVPTSAASKMARDLKERGLITWSHEGTGEEGTYVQLTEIGLHLITSQEQTLGRYLENVINSFGEEKALQLVLLLKELEDVLAEEHRKMADTTK